MHIFFYASIFVFWRLQRIILDFPRMTIEHAGSTMKDEPRHSIRSLSFECLYAVVSISLSILS